MIPDATVIRLSPEDRAVLEGRLRAPTTEQRAVFRARIVLLAAEGRSTRSIARELGTMPHGERLAHSLCRARTCRAGGQATARSDAEVRCDNRPAHPGASGSAATQGLCALDGAAAGRG